jgi:hypothetical protein
VRRRRRRRTSSRFRPGARARPSAVRGFIQPLAAASVAVGLSLVGHRVFVDAIAAIYYNADVRVPGAVEDAWLYAAVWGTVVAALSLAAYRRGVLRRGVMRVAAASLLVLDLSFLILLGVRGKPSDLMVAAGFSVVMAALGALAWRRPGLGGLLLFLVGGWLTLGTLVNSATYDGEAYGLLFDEDTFFIFSLGLIPLLAGVLSVSFAAWCAMSGASFEKEQTP